MSEPKSSLTCWDQNEMEGSHVWLYNRPAFIMLEREVKYCYKYSWCDPHWFGQFRGNKHTLKRSKTEVHKGKFAQLI